MLQYVTAGDEKVRDDHAILDGVVADINDPFWNTYYPPNDWNCRCDVIQLSNPDAPATDLEDAERFPDGLPVVARRLRAESRCNRCGFWQGKPNQWPPPPKRQFQ